MNQANYDAWVEVFSQTPNLLRPTNRADFLRACFDETSDSFTAYKDCLTADESSLFAVRLMNNVRARGDVGLEELERMADVLVKGFGLFSKKREIAALLNETRSKTPITQPTESTGTLDDPNLIANRYRKLKRIGDPSGQAEVWLADDTNIPDVPPVVVKIIKPHPKRDYTARFREEVRSVRELDEHRGIVQIYDFGVDASGTCYLVMPEMRGSLKAVLDETPVLEEATALDFLAQVAAALDYAHMNNVVHRDLKPANLLFTKGEGRLCLSDFGISYREKRAEAVSLEEETVGTEEYAAPEQLRHQPVTAKTDIYALAIIAYELLTGKRPFTGTKAEMSAAHLNLPLPENPAFDGRPFVLEALRVGAAKAPTDRPDTATAFVEQLRDALAGRVPTAVDHYLTDTLRKHILAVGSIKDLDVLDDTYVPPSGEEREQLTPATPDKPTDGLRPDLVDTEFALGFSLDDEPPAPPPMELHGAYHTPREAGYTAEPEYIPNVRDRLRELRRVVLLGAPGAGKTFTLARLALDYAAAHRTDPTEPLPAFVPLSTYDVYMPFEDFLDEHMGSLDYRSRDIVWLLDALNEMPQQHNQLPHLKAFINGLVARDVPFVLTCRVRNYDEELRDVPGLHRVDMQHLNPQQIYKILEHYVGEARTDEIWRGVMYGQYKGTSLLDAWAAWTGSVADFWKRPSGYSFQWLDNERARNHIHTDPRKLMLLCRNPFTLVKLLIPGIYAAVNHANQRGLDLAPLLDRVLPNNRAHLFQKIVEQTVYAEGQSRSWTDSDKSAIHAALAFTADALQAEEQRTETTLNRLLDDAEAPPHLHERLKMARDAGLLTVTENSVRFNHQLYQEYYATKRLRDLMDAYDRAHPGWDDGVPLPPRDASLSNLFTPWWEPAGWAVTVAMFGELQGSTSGLGRVVRWLASHSPNIALDAVTNNNDGATVVGLEDAAKQALIGGANARADEANPVGRAAAYHVLGHPDLDADDRPGVGLDEDGLPDVAWCEVPGGPFLMGSDPEQDKQAHNDEQPQRRVDVAAFAIGKYAVTNTQYRPFVEGDGYTNPVYWTEAGWQEKERKGWTQPRYWDNADYNDTNQPVVGVSWYEAYAYSQWLTVQLAERLPAGQVLQTFACFIDIK